MLFTGIMLTTSRIDVEEDMAYLYDVYILCQENVYRDYETCVLDQIQPCLPTYTKQARYNGRDVYLLEWNNLKNWSSVPSQTTREINVIREWVHGYVSNKHSRDGDGIQLICICEGETVVESVSNYVDTMPMDFYAEMHIHRPEGLEWKKLYSMEY